MKRKIEIISIVMLVVFVLCSCENVSKKSNNADSSSTGFYEEKSTSPENEENGFKEIIVVDQGDNYAIKDDQIGNYSFEIWDNNGDILDSDCGICYGTLDIEQKGNLIILTRNLGAGSYYIRYYDIEKCLISRVYQNPVAHTDNIVAYLRKQDKGSILILTSVFDHEYYEEIVRDYLIEYDYKYYLNGEFNENESELTIHYLIYPNNERAEETIIISKH